MAADIDIDVADRDQVLSVIRAIPARIMHNNKPRPHNSGIYAVPIPFDPVHQCAAIDYQEADDRGYIKIDLLNMSVYKLIKNPEHYQVMMDRSPPWSRLWQDPDWARQLVHVGNYTELLATMRPDSVPRMAAFIAIIRPGKAHLQNRAWPEVFESVWDGDSSRGFVFKKSHSISYSMLVALHMNLLDSTQQSD